MYSPWLSLYLLEQNKKLLNSVAFEILQFLFFILVEHLY
jgi:hypothetical protein